MTSSNGKFSTHVTGPLWGESFTRASDAEPCCFLWSAPEQTAEKTIEPRSWDAIALIMTSLQCDNKTTTNKTIKNSVHISWDIYWVGVPCSYTHAYYGFHCLHKSLLQFQNHWCTPMHMVVPSNLFACILWPRGLYKLQEQPNTWSADIHKALAEVQTCHPFRSIRLQNAKHQ